MRALRRIAGRTLAVLGLGFAIPATVAAGPAMSAESYALAMHGAPALSADFSHMPYANPAAPKGGRLVWGLLGTFDSLNPLIVRGLAVQQVRGFVVESPHYMACWQRASRRTMPEPTSRSISTRVPASRTASR